MIEETCEMRYGGKDYLIQSNVDEKIENGMNIKRKKRKENIQIGVVNNSLKALSFTSYLPSVYYLYSRFYMCRK
jgi:hypothetical protein